MKPRRNRRQPKKFSVIKANTMRISAFIVIAVVLAVMDKLAGSACEDLSKQSERLNKELADLERERKIQQAAYDALCTPDLIKATLSKLGMEMSDHPSQGTKIAVSKDGEFNAALLKVSNLEDPPRHAVNNKRKKQGR